MPGSSSTPPSHLPAFATFGELLKFLRRRARMTQTELSIAVGYSISQISRLEQNERFPDPATLLAVFVPALGLDHEPEIAARLVELAKTTAGGNFGVESSTFVPEVSSVFTSPEPVDIPLRHNLPHRLTSFVGRAGEIAELRQRIATSRLVTLTGAGGMGKTSLAVEVAQLADFRDGIWLVELASVQEAGFVAQAIITTFALPELTGRRPLDGLITYLQHKHLLLLLDNCEHLIATCAEIVDRLLRACPQLHILTTSREALNVEGEIEWLLFPLSVPKVPTDRQMRLKVSDISSYEAVHLFLDRVRTIKPDFFITDENAASVAQICAQLDGMPLALELAAARLKGMTVDEVAARLHDRFALLTSGRRTALLRHQTLQAAIGWSYDLLPTPEKVLFRQLSIFSGGWTVDAAEAMAADEHARKQTLTLLLQLLSKSLVVAEERGDETRYHMLETIRQYAAEKLQEAGEESLARRRHFLYFLTLAEQSHDSTLIGPRLTAWFNRITAEHNNLRSAFVWGQEMADGSELRLRLAGALGLFWDFRAGYDEGIAWLEEAVAHKGIVDPVVQAIALSRLANLLHRVGRKRPELVETALELFTQANHKEGIGYCLVIRAADMFNHQSMHLQALNDKQLALQLFRETGHLLFMGHTLCHVANGLHLSHQTEQAIPLYEECLDLGRSHDDIFLKVRALEDLGEVDLPYALMLCRQEVAYQRQQGKQEILAALLETLGRLLQNEGSYAEALPILVESLALWRQFGIGLSQAGGIARTHLDLGHNYFLLGDYLQTDRYMNEAIQSYMEVGDIHGIAWAQMILGYSALHQNQPDRAVAYFRMSVQHSSDSRMIDTPLMFLGLGLATKMLGNVLVAVRFFGVAAHYEDKQFLVPSLFLKFFLDTLASERTLLVDPVLAAAWTEGQQMSLEEAIILVRKLEMLL